MTLSKADQDKINDMVVDIIVIKRYMKFQTWVVATLFPFILSIVIWIGIKNSQINEIDSKVSTITQSSATSEKNNDEPISTPVLDAVIPKTFNYSKPKKISQ